MEILFTGVFSQFEASLVLVLFGVILTILASYAYQYIERIIRIFGPKKRDAKMEVRDEEVLKSRENNEKEEEEEKELPPPLTVEEIENTENLEEKTLSGDSEKEEEAEESETKEGEKNDKEITENADIDEIQADNNDEENTEKVEEKQENNEEKGYEESHEKESIQDGSATTETYQNIKTESSDLIAKIRQAEEKMNEESEENNEMQENNEDEGEDGMQVTEENCTENEEKKDDEILKSQEKEETMEKPKNEANVSEDTTEDFEIQNNKHSNSGEKESIQSDGYIETEENLSENSEEDTGEKEENKDTEEKKTPKDTIDTQTSETKDAGELSHSNTENTKKTFEEIERESDKDFSDEIAPETEKMEEESEEFISEKANDLIQKSSENIAEIMKKEVSKKENPHIEKLYELTNQAKTLMARGLMNEAKSTIIEGIALKKNHRELNLLLGEIYEAEKHFDKAEIIYKDLALEHTEDEDILKHLANNLIITKKTEIAYEIYKKIFSLGNDEENALYMLANLARELEDMSDAYHYSRLYLKKWPMDKDMLALLSESQIILGKRKEAIETLTKLKNLSPYDAAEISEYIEKLRTEEEMSKNFSADNDNS